MTCRHIFLVNKDQDLTLELVQHGFIGTLRVERAGRRARCGSDGSGSAGRGEPPRGGSGRSEAAASGRAVVASAGIVAVEATTGVARTAAKASWRHRGPGSAEHGLADLDHGLQSLFQLQLNVRDVLGEGLHADEHGGQSLYGHVGLGEVLVGQGSVGGAHEGGELAFEVAHD